MDQEDQYDQNQLSHDEPNPWFWSLLHLCWTDELKADLWYVNTLLAELGQRLSSEACWLLMLMLMASML